MREGDRKDGGQSEERKECGLSTSPECLDQVPEAPFPLYFLMMGPAKFFLQGAPVV